MKPKGKEENLEQWVSNRFGKRLYQHFFKTYTEKVWGVPTTELRAEWAAQRIKGLSFFSAAKAAFFGNGDNKIKSLITEFHYPRFGPGQMWETMCDEIIALGGEVRLNSPVEDIEIEDGRIVAIEAGGERIEPSEVISSLPLRATVGLAGPAAPRAGQAGGGGPALPRLPDRRAGDRRRGPVPGQLDLHPRRRGPRRPDPELPLLEPVDGPRPHQGVRGPGVLLLPGRRPVGDGRRRLVELAKQELATLGLVAPEKVERGFVTRVPLAYPMYDADYGERVDSIRAWLAGISNLQQVGRNGLHRYNNSDHSMLTAIRAVENIQQGTDHDIWAVNAESVYHEEDVADEHPYVRAPETRAMREPLARGLAPAARWTMSDGTSAMEYGTSWRA